jgi:hypothetical protein
MLSVSLSGRVRGVLANVGTVLFAAAWLTCISAFAIGTWIARDVPSGVTYFQIGRSRQPIEPIAAATRWWIRLAWFGWLLSIALMALMAIGGVVGLF